MFSAWKVAITIGAVNLASSTFAQLHSQVQSANTATQSLNAKLHTLGSVAQVGFGIAGSALMSFAEKGIKNAGDLEQAFTNIFNDLHINTAKGQRDMQNLVFQVSGTTKQSAKTISEELLAAGQAGLNQQQILTLFPQIAKFADLQSLGPGHMDPIHAVKIATQISHLEGAYSTSDMGEMLERLNKLGYTQPESLDKVLTQGKYFIPSARKLGMSIDDTMDITAMMGQTGLLGGRGGTGVAGTISGMLNGPALTGHAAEARLSALRGLGVVNEKGKNTFVDRAGHIEFAKLITQLAKVADKEKPDQFYLQLSKAFSATSIPFLQNLTRASVREQIEKTRERTLSMDSIDSMFKNVQKNFNYNAGELATNLENLSNVLFLPFLKVITPWIGRAAEEVAKFAAFISAHPNLGIGIATATLAGIATIFTAISVAALNMLFPVRGVFVAMGMGVLRLGEVIGFFGVRILPIIGWVALVAGALHYFTEHPKQVGRWVGEVLGWFQYQLFPRTIAAIEAWVPQVIGAFTSIFSGVVSAIQHGTVVASTQGYFADVARGFDRLAHPFVQGVNEGRRDQERAYHDNKTVHIHVSGAGDPHAVAKAVIDAQNRTSAFVQRAGAGSTSTPRISNLATMGFSQ